MNYQEPDYLTAACARSLAETYSRDTEGRVLRKCLDGVRKSAAQGKYNCWVDVPHVELPVARRLLAVLGYRVAVENEASGFGLRVFWDDAQHV